MAPGAGLLILGLLAAAVSASAAPVVAQATAPGPHCVIEQNFYFVRAGAEDEALAIRTEANRIRAGLGLPTGRIFRALERAGRDPASGEIGPGKTSYLSSEIEFETQAAADRAHETLMASPEFAVVRARMAKLLEGFETVTWAPAWGGCAATK